MHKLLIPKMLGTMAVTQLVTQFVTQLDEHVKQGCCG